MPKRPDTAIEVLFPIGGLNARLDYQQQPPFTTPDASNVFSDGMLTERQRGGMRPGVGKCLAAQLGSGAKVRLLHSVRFVNSSDENTVIACASANGSFYRENGGNWSVVTSDCSLAADRPLMAVDFNGLLYIADNGPILEEGSDGVIGGGSSNQLTSTAAGNFADGGVNDDDHFVVITSHNAVNEVQTITVDATGGYFIVVDEENGLSTANIAENASAATVQTELEVVYGVGNVAVSGTAPYTVTFQGELAGRRISLMATIETFLTGGASTATVARSTRGARTNQYANTYNITTVATTTVTISHTLQALTGVVFYIARCPKVYDPVANTLTKWIQDNYTVAELVERGLDTDLAGTPKGAIPVGRTIICQHFNRIYLGGGFISPQTFECSRIADPDDWDGSLDDAARASTASSETTARLGQPITALIPHQNSCMVIGTQSSLWVLRGDITAGSIQQLSPTVGIIDRFAWCETDQGILVFMTLGGVYAMADPCGGKPYSLSKERMPQTFINIDVASYTVSFAYCHRYRMVHCWVVGNSSVAPTTHWLVDIKSTLNGDSFGFAIWNCTLASHNYEPFIVHERKDTASPYSLVWMGGRDGYVRRFQDNLAQDDGTNFNSYVWIGPIMLGSGTMATGIINELQAIIPTGSGDVDCATYTGLSPELALVDPAPVTVEWNTAGHTPSSYPRKGDVAAWFKVSNGETNARWELSRIMLTVLPGGRAKP